MVRGRYVRFLESLFEHVAEVHDVLAPDGRVVRQAYIWKAPEQVKHDPAKFGSDDDDEDDEEEEVVVKEKEKPKVKRKKSKIDVKKEVKKEAKTTKVAVVSLQKSMRGKQARKEVNERKKAVAVIQKHTRKRYSPPPDPRPPPPEEEPPPRAVTPPLIELPPLPPPPPDLGPAVDTSWLSWLHTPPPPSARSRANVLTRTMLHPTNHTNAALRADTTPVSSRPTRPLARPVSTAAIVRAPHLPRAPQPVDGATGMGFTYRNSSYPLLPTHGRLIGQPVLNLPFRHQVRGPLLHDDMSAYVRRHASMASLDTPYTPTRSSRSGKPTLSPVGSSVTSVTPVTLSPMGSSGTWTRGREGAWMVSGMRPGQVHEGRGSNLGLASGSLWPLLYRSSHLPRHAQ